MNKLVNKAHPIERLQDIPDPGAKQFSIECDGELIEGFVIHWQGQIFAYRNCCPHTGVVLNWLPDQFFDIDQKLIQCSMHGALFQPADGLCVHGPCLNESLRPLYAQVFDGMVMVSCKE